ncbi:DUF2252 domain-containing protein [Trinickia caryophylli]|uniref:Uncharacterized conserved protein, DUF2252 family n=1 Tax=Trinickia caryophylli TaxID=28094 RepID=A0A1X7D033_TRICW|nr:DUF2252 domain-containing protein [Trinickia caryophylli]PMS13537.1 DUF2252 domain-containing protein [Trinickia caryophylli]TRX15297.1 DUF2252 domain-containing protein [Trinickia caryophylli]TRX15803.1 DUF2252 domain-containing protein [Trinickia caryophylli]TRX15809.1 DUF2252 domain-containing protein [Trinickia caryophylli]WQE15176.1 DUF2252 domain-containing protein [Trinickia caryophylli]
MNDVASTIAGFNAGRDGERLRMKYALMRESVLSFYRGTCHLFYQRLAHEHVLQAGPRVWVSGDLHLQNFGTYKADNGLVYFDINDFDEACLAPNLFEIVRLVTGVLVAADEIELSRAEALALCHMAVAAYREALRAGKARWIEAELAEGMVSELFDGLGKRSRIDHLDRRTTMDGKKRVLRADGKRALPVDKGTREQVLGFMTAFAEQQENREFYRPLDVARRIAGTGSLGVDRYVILVEGKGSPDGNYLIDLKEALPSSLAVHISTPQPGWRSDAERVVSVQQRMQAVSQAFLHAVDFNGRSYVLRSLQPSEDRVDLGKWNGKLPRLETVVNTMAQLCAWAQLRSGGRQGSAIADELIAFGARDDWPVGLIDLAVKAAGQVADDWRAYCASHDAGAFDVQAAGRR